MSPIGVGVELLDMDVLREKKVGPAVVIAGMLVLAVVYLRWQGRVWWCELHCERNAVKTSPKARSTFKPCGFAAASFARGQP